MPRVENHFESLPALFSLRMFIHEKAPLIYPSSQMEHYYLIRLHPWLWIDPFGTTLILNSDLWLCSWGGGGRQTKWIGQLPWFREHHFKVSPTGVVRFTWILIKHKVRPLDKRRKISTTGRILNVNCGCAGSRSKECTAPWWISTSTIWSKWNKLYQQISYNKKRDLRLVWFYIFWINYGFPPLTYCGLIVVECQFDLRLLVSLWMNTIEN